MGSNKLKIPPEFSAASSEQQVEFVQDLWDQIAKNPDKVPIPEAHKQLLQERLEDFQVNPEAGRSWEEVREELIEKFRVESSKDTSSRGSGR